MYVYAKRSHKICNSVVKNYLCLNLLYFLMFVANNHYIYSHKNNDVEISKNLVKYRFLNNFGPSK